MKVRQAWRLAGGALALAFSGAHVSEAGVEKTSVPTTPLAAFTGGDFTDNYCANCHDSDRKKGGLDLTTLSFSPDDPANFARWVKVHDRLLAHEMPPKKEDQPTPSELEAFVSRLTGALTAAERASYAREGRATQRRLNSYEYENALRDVLFAPWLEIRGELPEDGERANFNKIAITERSTHSSLRHWSRMVST